MKRSTLFGGALFVVMLVVVYIRVQNTTPHVITRTPPPKVNKGDGMSEPTLPAVFPVTLTTGSGRSVTIAAAPTRIVSLAPSTTEILYDIGAGDRIAADTTADDYPPAATKKPHIGGASDMSLERIVAQSPDLVVADSSINAAIIGILEDRHVPVLDVAAHTLDDVYADILVLGRATGHAEQATNIVSDMRSRMDAITKQSSHALSTPKVLIMYSASPIYTTGAGSYIDEVITAAGGHNIASVGESQISAEKVLAAQPDVIICPAMIIDDIERLPDWPEEVPAVKHKLYFDPSSTAVLTRPVPRMVAGAEQLAHFLHPELYTSSGQPADFTPTHHLQDHDHSGSR